MAKHKFQTEVSRLLHLIIHSLYSHPEIFLRELISNASDALDRLKYLTLTDEQFKGYAFLPRIDIAFDQQEQKWLSVSDSGIGMDAEELERNLGTIANSGTRQFLDSLAEVQRHWLPLGGGTGDLDWGHSPKINLSIKPSALYSQLNARSLLKVPQ